jgi:hypothetical protein
VTGAANRGPRLIAHDPRLSIRTADADSADETENALERRGGMLPVFRFGGRAADRPSAHHITAVLETHRPNHACFPSAPHRTDGRTHGAQESLTENRWIPSFPDPRGDLSEVIESVGLKAADRPSAARRRPQQVMIEDVMILVETRA